ncbi:helix-turn-helix transcriptional regulator [Ligaoa zhengdingensis]|uniref:helix-turn-helix domain-containing protein n=1 Tax=Ligaoa zhengdingensis TaxID=2763658 RepID=UPI0031CC49F2
MNAVGNITFGSFIAEKRKAHKFNLRDTAKHLNIAYGYLCDIEQSRRPAPNGDFVERISAFLNLDKSEHELLLDLAAKSRNTVSADLPDYIMEKDIVRAALRVAKEVDATDEELLEELNIERSVFYDRKREAIYLFSVCLFGYSIPEVLEELPRLNPD